MILIKVRGFLHRKFNQLPKLLKTAEKWELLSNWTSEVIPKQY